MSLAGSLGSREVLLIDDWIVNSFLFVLISAVVSYFIPTKKLTLGEVITKAEIVSVFLLVLFLTRCG